MLMQEANEKMIASWRDIWEEYRSKLRPNRKTGAEILEWLKTNYPLEEVDAAELKEVILGNLLQNEPFAKKIPEGENPNPVTFFVTNSGSGEQLYAHQDDIFIGQQIFVGLDLTTGFFYVEGSSLLFDELVAFRGLDEADIENFDCVAEYIACLKKFPQVDNCLV